MDIPISFRNLFARAGKSKAAALKAKCVDCSCFQRKEVELCPVRDCPLWPHRPYQPAGAKRRHSTSENPTGKAGDGSLRKPKSKNAQN